MRSLISPAEKSPTHQTSVGRALVYLANRMPIDISEGGVEFFGPADSWVSPIFGYSKTSFRQMALLDLLYLLRISPSFGMGLPMSGRFLKLAKPRSSRNEATACGIDNKPPIGA